MSRESHRPFICTWKEHDPWGHTPNTWDASCGLCWYLETAEDEPHDPLKGHEMNFCPKCGGKIVEMKYNAEAGRTELAEFGQESGCDGESKE